MTRPTIRSLIAASILAGVLLAGLARAQDDRSNALPTGSVWYVNQTTTQVTAIVNQGYRIVDLEVASVSPLRFDAAFVQNAGSFAKAWWWFPSISPAALSTFISANGARIIDLEPIVSGTSLTFAAVLIHNAGPDAKAWWWYYGTSTTTLGNLINQNNARLVDLERYSISGNLLRAAVMIRNTGSDARSWLYRTDVQASSIDRLLNNGARRIYDIEQGSLGRYDCVMIDNTGSYAVPWWYYYSLTPAAVNFVLAQNGARLIDLQRVGSNFNVVMLSSANPLSRRVADLMAARSDGERGVYLKRVNGPVLAWILADHAHEPASTLKTLHHVHAMRRVLVDPHVSLQSQMSVFTGNAPNSCPSLNTGRVLEPLQSVVSDMMMASDNTRTRAVTDYFGMSNLNATAASLGLSDTAVNHHIGCGTPANQTTLVDIGRLHEHVANGYLGSLRQTFYDLMRSDFYSTGYAEAALGPILDAEAASVGLSPSQKTAFISAMDVAHKKGGYGVAGGYYRCWGAYVSIPFYVSGGIDDREYVTGAFVARASDEARAIDAAKTGAAEVLRGEIRAAMITWRDHVPGIVTSIGAGCAGTAGVPSHTYSGVPELGQRMTYRLGSAAPGSAAVLNFGFSSTQWAGWRLPLDLGIIGAPGCRLLTAPDVSYSFMTTRTGEAGTTVRLGSSPSLIGAEWFTQWLIVDPGANAASLVVSNGLRTRMGGNP